MTPLLGTKTPSAPVGDKSDGERRAARSLLPCALWPAAWGGYGAAWAASRPPRRQHCLSRSPAVRYFFWSEPCPPTMVFTRHETRDTNHGFYKALQSFFRPGDGSLYFSPRGEAKCVRGPSGLGASRAEEKGASRLARAGVLEQYVEHGKQAQRSPGGHMACFDRRVVRNAG